jgi:hypothetical protein
MDGRLRQLFKAHLPEMDWVSIDVTSGRGVPDSNACFKGVEFWIEHKATKGRRVIMRPEQVGWIERRMRHGGRVFISVRRFNSRVDELYLLWGASARFLARGEWPEVAALGHWAGGPSKWNWLEIKEILLP